MFIISCKQDFNEPVISLDSYKIENGFQLELAASEPLLVAPVAIDFDTDGRIWVAEMSGFMKDIEGNGEEEPSGSIKILEDLDNDGVMDHAKTFLDSLVMPRALALVYGGLLYAEPPNLYFVDIKDDKPVNRVLVDSLYATGGNPEHQPNGLLLNIDNWIYNAKSHFRYQRKNGKWLKEPTSHRGQWGISQDNFGRLYYNNNSNQLLGDYILPNRAIRNKFFTPKASVNKKLTNDQRVYPINAASVNRGYIDGVLNEDSLLVSVTAACGPLVYRGGNFPQTYSQNAFVCIPEANLIKRNILSFSGYKTEAKQAWNDREFLASTDEGFRPVNLNIGPDGNMYVVDMHRGVIQHQAYLTSYLKKKSEEKGLDTIINYGRILRIKHTNSTQEKTPNLNTLSGIELVKLLNHKNGWVRDQAQHHIIFKNEIDAVSALKELTFNNKAPLAQIHALYTLKGLNSLNFETLTNVAEGSSSDVASHAIVLLEDFISENNIESAKSLFEKLAQKNDPGIDLYLSSSIGSWAKISNDDFFPLLISLSNKYKSNSIVQETIVSGLSGIEPIFKTALDKNDVETNPDIDKFIANSIAQKKDKRTNTIFSSNSLPKDSRTEGAKMFRQICAACHGSWGEGIEGLAPPLMKSEFLAENMDRLGLIILHGLKGTVTVKGTEYNLNHPMPGLNSNKSISDKDIADIISFTTNAFSNSSKSLKEDRIKELRDIKPKSGAEFTVEELAEITK